MNIAEIYARRKSWDAEPNFYAFTYKDHECLIVRGMFGYLSGYVKTDVFSDIYTAENNLENITVQNRSVIITSDVYNVDRDDDDSGIYWVGFSCNSSDDILPAVHGTKSVPGKSYKTMSYVKENLKILVDLVRAQEIAYIANESER
jgi:hypothetical protein